MPTSELIVKDNALINASYNLDTVEQRLILLAILQARETRTGIDANTRLRIHASDYMSRFNVNKHAAYKALKTAVTNLLVDSLAIKQLMKKQENQRKLFLDGFKIFLILMMLQP
jgi:plasmid replication initiation protein